MVAMTSLGREGRAVLQYAVEMAAAVALVFGAKWLSQQVAGQTVSPVQLLPIIPIWLIIVVSLRYYLRIDEFQRLKFLQAVALTAGITLGLHWSWPSIQAAFGPHMAEPDLSIPFALVYVVVTAALLKVRSPR